MHKESKTRSAVKTISWRVLATLTTTTLVFIFTKKIYTAVTIGSLEAVAKIILYFLHERLWNKITFGKKEVVPFVIWFTGLPASGKTAIADSLAKKLTENNYVFEHLHGKQVRSIFPEIGFDKLARDEHIKRIGLLASILEKNKVIVVASFISPYKEARSFVRNICKNFIEVYVDTPIEVCQEQDKKGLYIKAEQGLIENFTGINDPYEPPDNPEIILDTRRFSLDECVNQVLIYLRKNRFLI
ncbi:MAG: adenylyl-sulfate kinase [Candidatus Omnitrophica bacterium]|nr:adenylyl-sulfate kinase [Candidatus Omnitrophota bacterium]